jgi:hypothetical protein
MPSGRPGLRGFAHIPHELAVTIMVTAALAFIFQGAFIAAAQTITGENHYHHGYAHKGHVSHVATHVHADGTVHRHVVDDDDDGLNSHIQEPGCPCCWNMAVLMGVLPSPILWSVFATLSGTLAPEISQPSRGTEPGGPRKPPRPPSIA